MSISSAQRVVGADVTETLSDLSAETAQRWKPGGNRVAEAPSLLPGPRIVPGTGAGVGVEEVTQYAFVEGMSG